MPTKNSSSPLLPAALLALSGLAAAIPQAALADVTPTGGMIRYPDLGKTHIVFVYAGGIWMVPRAGGVATRLADPPGQELFPKFSPDDKTVAFVGNYDGGRDIYTIPVDGGTATRVTYHPGPEQLCDWTPDGKGLLYFTSGLGGLRRQNQLMTIPATGGMPTQLPVPYGANGALNADGTILAYTPHTTDFRTWKRYRGGMATDIWLFNLQDKTSKQITTWEGNDTDPMWFRDKVYYLTDMGDGPTGYEGDHRMNLWSYDTKSGTRKQLTSFKDFDCKWPSMGPDGAIVFQNGPGIYTLEPDGKPREVKITISGDRPLLRAHEVEDENFIRDWSISPSGKRAAVEARGDIWSLPAEKGSPRNLSRSAGSAERYPAWSPDGRWLAYFSDATGEYELYVTQSDGYGRTIQLTKAGDAPEKFRFNPTWSPDSKMIAFADKTGAQYLCTLGESDGEGGLKPGSVKLIDTDPWGNLFGVSWSHDSKWITYTKQEPGSTQNAVWLYNIAKGAPTRVTSGFFNDSSPAFDRKGEYLFFVSTRSFNPRYSDIDTTFIYAGGQQLFAIPLKADADSPWAPKSDEEDWRKALLDKAKDKKPDDKAGEGKDSKDDKPSKSKDAAAKDDPVSGSWEGSVTGPDPVPPGGMPFTLTLTLGEGGKVTGDFVSPIHGGSIASGTWDAASKTLTFNLQVNENAAQVTLKIDNGTMTGTALVGEQKFSLEGKRSAAGGGGDSKAAKSGADEKSKDVVIDLDGLEARALTIPVPPGNFGGLGVNDKNQLLYVRRSSTGGEDAGIKLFDLTDEKREEKSVASGNSFDITPDGKKILIARGGSATIQDASAGATGKSVSTTPMLATIDPRAEWRQILVDAWRMERDFFYVAGMHGVDWNAVRERYGAMVEDCASRDDLSFVISEMISELNIGHAYYSGGDVDSGPHVGVGMLGCDFALENGAYRITKVYRGAAWDLDAKGPLSQPGCTIKEGDYLLAVNGVPLDAAKDPWAAFVGLAGRTVTLTVNDKPSLERELEPKKPEPKKDEAKKDDSKKDDSKKDDDSKKEPKKTTGLRDVIVTTLGSEDNLRYRDWIETKRAYVEKQTDGKVGYIYVPNTGADGQSDLFRQFYGQIGKKALIIDERWNGGGQIPTRFIELLNRPITNYWARREGPVNPWPPDSMQGPKCMLINGLAGSGGDMFPWLFKDGKIGKLIGMRTWGGLVGYSGEPPLVDGGSITAPSFGFFKRDGTWGVEGHGVDPDMVVIDDPAKMQRDASGWVGDPQLDAAIAHMKDEMEKHPYTPPKRPADPDRSGMGVLEKDR